MAYETLTPSGAKFDRKVSEGPSTEQCSFIDARFDPNCKNWTDTLHQGHPKTLEFTSILANSKNGRPIFKK